MTIRRSWSYDDPGKLDFKLIRFILKAQNFSLPYSLFKYIHLK